jgi:hypothetical protein
VTNYVEDRLDGVSRLGGLISFSDFGVVLFELTKSGGESSFLKVMLF